MTDNPVTDKNSAAAKRPTPKKPPHLPEERGFDSQYSNDMGDHDPARYERQRQLLVSVGYGGFFGALEERMDPEIARILPQYIPIDQVLELTRAENVSGIRLQDLWDMARLNVPAISLARENDPKKKNNRSEMAIRRELDDIFGKMRAGGAKNETEARAQLVELVGEAIMGTYDQRAIQPSMDSAEFGERLGENVGELLRSLNNVLGPAHHPQVYQDFLRELSPVALVRAFAINIKDKDFGQGPDIVVEALHRNNNLQFLLSALVREADAVAEMNTSMRDVIPQEWRSIVREESLQEFRKVHGIHPGRLDELNEHSLALVSRKLRNLQYKAAAGNTMEERISAVLLLVDYFEAAASLYKRMPDLQQEIDKLKMQREAERKQKLHHGDLAAWAGMIACAIPRKKTHVNWVEAGNSIKEQALVIAPEDLAEMVKHFIKEFNRARDFARKESTKMNQPVRVEEESYLEPEQIAALDALRDSMMEGKGIRLDLVDARTRNLAIQSYVDSINVRLMRAIEAYVFVEAYDRTLEEVKKQAFVYTSPESQQHAAREAGLKAVANMPMAFGFSQQVVRTNDGVDQVALYWNLEVLGFLGAKARNRHALKQIYNYLVNGIPGQVDKYLEQDETQHHNLTMGEKALAAIADMRRGVGVLINIAPFTPAVGFDEARSRGVQGQDVSGDPRYSRLPRLNSEVLTRATVAMQQATLIQQELDGPIQHVEQAVEKSLEARRERLMRRPDAAALVEKGLEAFDALTQEPGQHAGGGTPSGRGADQLGRMAGRAASGFVQGLIDQGLGEDEENDPGIPGGRSGGF